MPRANRHFLPGLIWHITHRCHQKDFLLKFAHDRARYLYWLFEAKKRIGLCVLNYVVTSNHVHLLVRDSGEQVIAQSMQLIAGRTAQEYNQRKARKGAFWEDRYHATAIEADSHLHRCLVYMDLNMVRAGVVNHPADWTHSGYREIQHPPKRYTVIDLVALSTLCGFERVPDFQRAHREWVEEILTRNQLAREDRWSTSLAIGSQAYVEKIKDALGNKALNREVRASSESHTLREAGKPYSHAFDGKNGVLRLENTHPWNDSSKMRTA
jgi:putative transposase